MKKAIALLLALVMVFALCACGGGDKGTADNGEKVVKIGVFEPASGDSGAGGKKEMLGMQYANQETPTVEIGGETYNVELGIVDNESSNDKARPTRSSSSTPTTVPILRRLSRRLPSSSMRRFPSCSVLMAPACPSPRPTRSSRPASRPSA